MAGDLFNNPSAYFSIDTGKGSEDVMEMVSSEWKVAGLLILKVSPYGIIAISHRCHLSSHFHKL